MCWTILKVTYTLLTLCVSVSCSTWYRWEFRLTSFSSTTQRWIPATPYHPARLRWESYRTSIWMTEVNSTYQVVNVSPGASKLRVRCQRERKQEFKFFGPHHLLVQKVQTSSITQKSGRVSPPPPSRITTFTHLHSTLNDLRRSRPTAENYEQNHQSTTKVTLTEPPIRTRMFYNRRRGNLSQSGLYRSKGAPYLVTSQSHVIERILKLTPIHTLLILSELTEF